MAVKAPAPVPESGLFASLHKDVWTHHPKPKLDFRDEIETPRERERERKRERERERAHSVPILFYYSRVFIVFKGGEGLSNDELALVVMIAQ